MKVTDASAELLKPAETGEEMLKKLELIGRVCYKSEHKIGEGTAAKFVKSLIKSGHESVIEHGSLTMKFICDRGVSHEIVRHRIASYSQESSRYCVAGNMKLTVNNPHVHITVEDLYKNAQESKNGAWKKFSVRQYNEDTGELQYAKVKNIVCNGKKTCLEIKTKLGYSIVCTSDHRILTKQGYEEAGNLKIGGEIMVNGTDALYMNRDWLYYQSITLDKTFVDIAKEFGFGLSAIKKWARKLGIPKKGRMHHFIGKTPWNKGITDDRQAEALRKYHHCGRRKETIMKEDTVNYRKHISKSCGICGETEWLVVHHIDFNHGNNNPENLVTLCDSCHERVHSRNLLTAYADKITEIKEVGVRTVYDIEMNSEYHNFVANGVVVHNCNYSKDDFGSEITVIKPFFFDEGTKAYYGWWNACKYCESQYFYLLSEGATAQEARTVLPNSLKTELYMTANLREWRHFFKLRASAKAHPQMREVAILALNEAHAYLPVVFDDLWEGEDEQND